MTQQTARAFEEHSTTHGKVTAGAFASLVEAFERVRIPLAQHEAHSAAEREREALRQLIEGHVDDAAWRVLLHQAREAAEHGAHECLLLRFPSDLCTDRGRAINVQEPDWAETLTGDAASIYRRWKTGLAPHGFTLTARILEFPNGIPGDAGLFLGWSTAGGKADRVG